MDTLMNTLSPLYLFLAFCGVAYVVLVVVIEVYRCARLKYLQWWMYRDARRWDSAVGRGSHR